MTALLLFGQTSVLTKHNQGAIDMNIRSRLNRIEDMMPDGGGRCYLDIWSLSDEQWAKLAAWAMGETEEVPDFWPSDEQAAHLRNQGYHVETRQELRDVCEMLIDSHRKKIEAGSGLDYESIGIKPETIE
jgi:hypothetical protein